MLLQVVVILVIFAGFSYLVYDLFFKKNQDELTRLEKRYTEREENELL